MLNREIINIFKQKLNENISKIAYSYQGHEQTVKIVATEKNKYVLKIPQKRKGVMIYRENFVCTKLKNIKIPKVILKTETYLIESFIEGQNLNELKIKKDKQAKIYQELGKNIKKIHQIKMTGLGTLQNNGRGQHNTPLEHIKAVLKTNLLPARKRKVFNKTLTKNIKTFLYNNINLFETNKSVLLHFDFTDGNILVKNNKLSGIIDFGDASCGPIEYDLAKLYIEKPQLIFEQIIKGYGQKQIDLKKIKYFTVLHLLYMLPYFYRKNKTRYQKDIKLLKNIIKLAS